MRIIKDYAIELKALEDCIRNQAVPGSILQILEAGCGREWYFALNGISYDITGIDLDRDALHRRTEQKKDLKHAIIGDLRTVELPSASFDVVYCSFVLEHVHGAELVLKNFVRWLRPGGMLIIRVPDLSSVQSFFARRVPHSISVLYYKYAWRIKDAGKPGFAPYPPVYDNVISQSGLRDFCARNGLLIEHEFGVGTYAANKHGIFRIAVPAFARVVHWLSLGTVQDRYVDLTFVIRKPPGQAASPRFEEAHSQRKDNSAAPF